MPLTYRECAIIETYTGYCMCAGERRDEVYKYMQEIMERPVWTHEFADHEIQKELRDKSRADFIALAKSAIPDDGIKPVFKRRVDPVLCTYTDGSTGVEERGFADWCCGNCGEPVGEQYILTKHDQKKCNFCPRCGLKVDWKAAKKENEK